jgi:hypothetical protein
LFDTVTLAGSLSLSRFTKLCANLRLQYFLHKLDSMVFHDGYMHCIVRPISQDNMFRTLSDGPINGQHLIHDADQSVKRRLDCVAPVDSDVAVQDFLENLGVRNQALALADHLFEQSSRAALVGMRSAN